MSQNGDQTHQQNNTNTTTNTNNHPEDYRFFNYRLDQLETNLRKGQEKLEREQSQNYKELIKMLQIMQESSNEQNKTIIKLNQRIITIETTMKCIDKLKEVATIHKQRVDNIDRRLEIYKQILFIIGSVAVTSFLTALFELVMK